MNHEQEARQTDVAESPDEERHDVLCAGEKAFAAAVQEIPARQRLVWAGAEEDVGIETDFRLR